MDRRRHLHHLSDWPPGGATCISYKGYQVALLAFLTNLATTCISYKFGLQVAPFVEVTNLATRQCHLQQLQIWPQGGAICRVLGPIKINEHFGGCFVIKLVVLTIKVGCYAIKLVISKTLLCCRQHRRLHSCWKWNRISRKCIQMLVDICGRTHLSRSSLLGCVFIALCTAQYAAIESNRELTKSLKVIALHLLIFGPNMIILFLTCVKP